MNAVNGMIKVNLRQIKPAYLVTGILFIACTVAAIVTIIILQLEGLETLSLGNYLIIFPLLVGILIPALNFSKLMNLGGTRIVFFKACMLNYTIAAFFTSLLCLAIRLIVDPIMSIRVPVIVNLFDVFGFTQNGMVVAFFQMGVFLLFAACVAHTLTLLQGHWYGWIVDAVIILAVCLIGVAPVRSLWMGFFNMIIFHDLALVQLASCVILSVAIYAVSVIPIKTKRIGA
jgi:hypothetical protein